MIRSPHRRGHPINVPDLPDTPDSDEKPIPLSRFGWAYGTAQPAPDGKPVPPSKEYQVHVFAVTVIGLLVAILFFEPSWLFMVLFAALGCLGVVAASWPSTIRRILRGALVVLGGSILGYVLLVLGTFLFLFLVAKTSGPLLKMQ